MEAVRGAGMELCRLCGAQEGKLLHLHDTFSTLGTTSTILQLLQSISVFLKVQVRRQVTPGRGTGRVVSSCRSQCYVSHLGDERRPHV